MNYIVLMCLFFATSALADLRQGEKGFRNSSADAQAETSQISPKNETERKQDSDLSELEKAQLILQQYKPLTPKRSYEDLLVYGDNRTPLQLNRLPALGERILPAKPPNLKVIPYLLKSFAHPGYNTRFKNVEYVLAVSCEPPVGFDDCSTVSQNAFGDKHVFVKFIQTSDPRFRLGIKGGVQLKVGDSFSKINRYLDGGEKILGDGECVHVDTYWAACFDADNLAVHRGRLSMMPAENSRVKRFLKIAGPGY